MLFVAVLQVIGSSTDRTISNTGQKSTLVIHSVSSHDYGQYECSATNSQGTQNFDVELLKPGNTITDKRM